RALIRDLQRELARAHRHRRRFSVLVADMDGLKRLNDTEGHAAGDVALRELAGRLREALRAGDAAYRIGGDEFAALLPEADEVDARSAVARVAIGSPPFTWGTATYPDDGTDVDGLLDVADRRLYERRAALRGE